MLPEYFIVTKCKFCYSNIIYEFTYLPLNLDGYLNPQNIQYRSFSKELRNMHMPEQQNDQFDLNMFLNDPNNKEIVEAKSTNVTPNKTDQKKSGKTKGQPKRRQPAKENSDRRVGHWVLTENKRYHWFLEIHHNHFMNKHLRRVDRIFKIMQKFLGTREAEQCRSHHQKMQKRHGSFSKILLFLRRQHYNTETTKGMKQQMQQNDVEVIDGLVSAEQLHNSEKVQKNKQQQEIEQFDNADYEISQLIQLKQESKHVQNIMDDNYEDCIEFHGFMNP